ncbi:uncharacterized protein PADG_08495 [Paracoccidioides brasiliensis Pb18]|uniref:Uncharacterized protein n=1 Tax=Paracoccidioides brasiliensis (strain Pb18) TaxID=502780 RepID=C1GMK9_PARBD|nr:uncharacterized protein PADG_08495 [Paracoccidioides brasiliensis Pb18]EEH43675.2 hypothetical protein PADG_08495 [Paracoccidioides brasiliensis Pb18]
MLSTRSKESLCKPPSVPRYQDTLDSRQLSRDDAVAALARLNLRYDRLR